MKKILSIAIMICGIFAPFSAIAASCSFYVAQMNFGPYYPIRNMESTSDTDIVVHCDAGTSYSINVDKGFYGTDEYHRMLGGNSSDINSLLKYNIFKDVARTSIWDRNGYSGTGDGNDQIVPIYGVIFQGQTTAVPGTYSDTLQIVVNY